MDFRLSYDEAKTLLTLFYQAPYGQAAAYVALLDNLKQIDGDQTLRQTIEAEHVMNTTKAEEVVHTPEIVE